METLHCEVEGNNIHSELLHCIAPHYITYMTPHQHHFTPNPIPHTTTHFTTRSHRVRVVLAHGSVVPCLRTAAVMSYYCRQYVLSAEYVTIIAKEKNGQVLKRRNNKIKLIKCIYIALTRFHRVYRKNGYLRCFSVRAPLCSGPSSGLRGAPAAPGRGIYGLGPGLRDTRPHYRSEGMGERGEERREVEERR